MKASWFKIKEDFGTAIFLGLLFSHFSSISSSLSKQLTNKMLLSQLTLTNKTRQHPNGSIFTNEQLRLDSLEQLGPLDIFWNGKNSIKKNISA